MNGQTVEAIHEDAVDEGDEDEDEYEEGLDDLVPTQR